MPFRSTLKGSITRGLILPRCFPLFSGGVANGTAKREPSGPVACGENEDASVENYGLGIAEVARQVGIATSGVSKILTRTLST